MGLQGLKRKLPAGGALVGEKGTCTGPEGSRAGCHWAWVAGILEAGSAWDLGELSSRACPGGSWGMRTICT